MPRRCELELSERFTIESMQGLPIRGIVQAPADPQSLVVLIHGFKGFMQWGFFPWLAEDLVSRGFAVCRFDFSRNGVGEAGEDFDELDLFADDTYSLELDDLSRVIAHLAERPVTGTLPVSLVGHSRGGAIALLGAASVENLASVVTWSSISALHRWDEATVSRWRSEGSIGFPNARTGQTMRVSTAILDDLERRAEALDLDAAIRRLPAPLLVIHGATDDTVPVSEAHRIAGSAPDVSTVILNDASHTYGAIHPLVHVPFELTMAANVTAAFIRCN